MIHAWISSRPPNRLLAGAIFFALSGALAVGSSFVGLIERSPMEQAPANVHAPPLWAIALLFALGVGWMRAGVLLWQRRAAGVTWALLSLLLFASSWLLGNRPSTSDILLTVCTLGLLAIMRSDLATEKSAVRS